VLWSRLGPYDLAVLENLLWRERRLFEYWAHAASIVPTSDYEIHEATLMRRWPSGDVNWGTRIRDWMRANDRLRRSILRELRTRGPLPTRELPGPAKVPWGSTGWTDGQSTTRMLEFLWAQGRVLVGGRKGSARLWDIPERCLPPGVLGQPRLRVRDAVRAAAERSLRGLGIARVRDIREHFVRGRYPGLPAVLAGLQRAGRIVPATVDAESDWWIHADDLPLLERLEAGEWEPRTTLLSPFDNLIADRARTERFFGFRFRLEIYVPKADREHGYFVMPVVHGDRLVGRLDPAFDRKTRRLVVHAVHAEPDAPTDAGPALAEAVGELARFLDADDVVFPRDVPAVWRRTLRTA